MFIVLQFWGELNGINSTTTRNKHKFPLGEINKAQETYFD